MRPIEEDLRMREKQHSMADVVRPDNSQTTHIPILGNLFKLTV